MTFWKFCEKTAGFVGTDLVIAHIHMVFTKYKGNQTVGNAVDAIRESERNRE